MTATVAERVRVPVVLGVAGGAGLVWGIAVRAWMRLIAEDPEFTWSGTIFIVGAASVAGLGMGLAFAARRNGWRFGKVASTLGGFLILPLGMGAGSMMLATVVPGGVALGRPRLGLPVRLAILAPVVLIGLNTEQILVAAVVVGALAILLLSGYRTRTVVAALASLPFGFVLFGVLTSDLPLMQRLAGTVAYPLLVAPLLLWFSRTVAPIEG